jgi:uncharacterized protein CbrC (UPF0167 family)
MTKLDTTDLPVFHYHPDPVATGSIVASEAVCKACGLARGWIYTGPTYCTTDLDESLCPWCIGDGTAHSKFKAQFVDPEGIGDFGNWSSVSKSVFEEVCFRTPGFNGFQQERWFTHCHDAAVFLGCAGKAELERLDRAAYDAIKLESGYDEEQWNYYFDQMDATYGPTAYLFRCRHCAAWGGYSDCA